MADPNLIDFYGRLQRVRDAHQRGHGFDASGTLGRGFVARKRRRGAAHLFRLLKPAAIIAIALVGVKGVIYSEIGAGNYANRLEAMRESGPVAKAGAVLMQSDPLTVYVAGLVSQARR